MMAEVIEVIRENEAAGPAAKIVDRRSLKTARINARAVAGLGDVDDVETLRGAATDFAALHAVARDENRKSLSHAGFVLVGNAGGLIC